VEDRWTLSFTDVKLCLSYSNQGEPEVGMIKEETAEDMEGMDLLMEEEVDHRTGEVEEAAHPLGAAAHHLEVEVEAEEMQVVVEEEETKMHPYLSVVFHTQLIKMESQGYSKRRA
jgi:hypothetical protein